MPAQNLARRLADLSPYIYGTTRLGDEAIPFAERIRIAGEAMKTGVWFHASDQYGGALAVLAEAFKCDPDHIPQMIFKIEVETVPEIREVIKRNIRPIGVDYMDIGQLCLRDRTAADFIDGSEIFDEFSRIKQEGLVKRYVMEVFPWTSPVALEAIKSGCTHDLVDGLIFYLNPLQRFALNDLWELIEERQIPVIAMRTVCGNSVHALRDVPGAAWKEYIQQRAVEVAPVFEQSDVAGWAEFCVRFAHSFPFVRATVGATAKTENLNKFLRVTGHIQPLPEEIMSRLARLQRQWSDDFDKQAEPWSM